MICLNPIVSIIGRPMSASQRFQTTLSASCRLFQVPQTTRNAIKAIINTDNSQIVLIDTPAYTSPNKLGEYMVKLAEYA